MLVTIEGIDGSGKSTLHKALGHALADMNPVLTREPGSTWIGDAVRKAIRDQIDPIAEALLFVADHAAHLNKIVKPALNEGKLVLSDRYIDSRYAYQQVSLEGVIPDPETWLKALHDNWTIMPDLTILIVIPISIALERTSDRNLQEHFEEEKVLADVQRNYMTLAESDPQRFVILDGTLPKEDILMVAEDTIRNRRVIIGKKREKTHSQVL